MILKQIIIFLSILITITAYSQEKPYFNSIEVDNSGMTQLDITTKSSANHQLQITQQTIQWHDVSTPFITNESEIITKIIDTHTMDIALFRIQSSPVFYVSPMGANTNDGSFNSPWKTIQYAIDNCSAGATILVRTGVYNEKIRFKKSGNVSDGFISLKNFQNETPVIDGTDLSVDEYPLGLISISSKSYINIDGFEIRNFKNATEEHVPAGIFIDGTANHIEIRNCFIHHIESDYTLAQPNAFGIIVYGTDRTQPANHIIIDSNEVANCKLGSSETIAINGNVETFEITHNIVHNNDNIGIVAIGYEGTSPNETLDRARDGIIADNRVFNIQTIGNIAYTDRSSDGIYVDGGTDIVIERNTVFNCDIGIELASEHAGKLTENIITRSNFIFNNYGSGLSMGGYDSKRGGTKQCKILHNTFFNNDTGQDGSGEITFQYHIANCEIKNNIIYSTHNYFIVSITSTQNISIDYTLYYMDTPSNWLWNNTEYENVTEWQSATQFDTNSLVANPLFLNSATGNLHIEPLSPAKNSGISNTNSGLYDIDHNPRIIDAIPDIGADEI